MKYLKLFEFEDKISDERLALLYDIANYMNNPTEIRKICKKYYIKNYTINKDERLS